MADHPPAGPDDVFDTAVRDALQLPKDAPLQGLRYEYTPEWDSVAHLQLIASLEAAFGVDIDASHVLSTSSYESLRNLLREEYGLGLSE